MMRRSAIAVGCALLIAGCDVWTEPGPVSDPSASPTQSGYGPIPTNVPTAPSAPPTSLTPDYGGPPNRLTVGQRFTVIYTNNGSVGDVWDLGDISGPVRDNGKTYAEVDGGPPRTGAFPTVVTYHFVATGQGDASVRFTNTFRGTKMREQTYRIVVE